MLNIIGINISDINTYDTAYKKVLSSFQNSSSLEYITVNNVHTIITATRNKNYKDAINNSFLALPDGKPLSIYAKVKGYKDVSRIFGPTFMEKTLEWGQKDGLKHYFFGSSEETIMKMLNNIRTKYPAAIIAGYCSPPYKDKFDEEENNLFLKNMNESAADIYWIGLGAPKQEIWMYENYKKLNRGVMIGIGAGFDYLAGNIKHAPKWMKNCALEWLYRLIQDPKRLWKRYLVTNTLFLYYCVLDLLHIKNFDT